MQPLQTVNLTLPAIPVTPGTHTLEVASSAPNGNADEVETNDIWTYDFTVSNPQGDITLLLTLDDFGSDVTWTLATDLGAQLYEGGPYPDFENGMVDTVHWCLTNGCYIFTIYDAFGDGICCEQGEGHYEIFDADSLMLAESDGDYTDQNENTFCVTVVGVEETSMGELQVFPNPTTDVLYVRSIGIGRMDALDLVDAAGRTVYSSGPIDSRSSIALGLHGLAPGSYTLIALVDDSRITRRVIVQP